MIVADLATAGFEGLPEIEAVEHTSRAATAVAAATAFCGGTPLRDELAGGGRKGRAGRGRGGGGGTDWKRGSEPPTSKGA